MNTERTWEVGSTSYEDTLELGERLGSHLRGGEVLELVGDLGAGKTAFTTGLAKGIGYKENVTSPTFTISKEYKGNKLILFHFDFYRLPEPGLMSEQLQEVIDDPNAVLVVEWAAIVSSFLPTNRVSVHIERDATNENMRHFVFKFRDELAYILKDTA